MARMICNRCLHCDVCKFANAKINSDTKVKDIESNLAFSNCKDFIDKNNSEKCGEWISVKDGLPEKDGNYLCRYYFDKDSMKFTNLLFYYATDEFPHWQYERAYKFTVTHWMPLPEPPKGDC